MVAAEAAPLIWINGFPGTGKFTVARAIASLHKLIDPVAAWLPRSHPDYDRERQKQRQLAFDEYASNPDRLADLLIFTDFQSNNELGRRVAGEYLAAAEIAGRPFVPAYLTCDVDTNLGGIATQERINSGTTKLTNAKVLEDIRSRCKLFVFECRPGLSIDITDLGPLEAASKILDFAFREIPSGEGR